MKETYPAAAKQKLAAHLGDSEAGTYFIFHHLLYSAVTEGAP